MNKSRPINPTSARIGELLRLQALLSTPDVALDEVRAYQSERIETLLPPAYLLYRRRWRALPPSQAPGPLLGFGDWSEKAEQLQEIIDVADLLDEEPEGPRVEALQRVLLVEETASRAATHS